MARDRAWTGELAGILRTATALDLEHHHALLRDAVEAVRSRAHLGRKKKRRARA